RRMLGPHLELRTGQVARIHQRARAPCSARRKMEQRRVEPWQGGLERELLRSGGEGAAHTEVQASIGVCRAIVLQRGLKPYLQARHHGVAALPQLYGNRREPCQVV